MKQNEPGKFYKAFMLFLAISIFVTIIGSVFWALIKYNEKPELDDPLPILNNSKKIDLIQIDHLLSGSCDHFSFGGEKLQAFATQETESAILTFYRQIAKDNNMSERISDYVVSFKDGEGVQFESMCLWGGKAKKNPLSFKALYNIKSQPDTNNRTPQNIPLDNQKTDAATMVALLDMKDHSGIIQQVTKNVPLGTSYLVILIQGYIYYI